MAVRVGNAELPVVPVLTKNFSRNLATQMVGPATRTANRAGNDAGRTFGKRFGTSARVGLGPVTGIVRGFGGALAGAFAGVAVVSGLKATISAASDLQETLNKNRVVFGTSARSVEQWSKRSATSFGLSRNAALGAAAQFGEMFHQLGFTQKQAAKTSKSLVQTAADLGSFHNVDPSDVLERIGAALRGEYDSLQQLIPNINAARVEQEALRMTHKTSVKDITAAEKATAVLAIVQRDGANAAGDFAKTSDNAANRQRILAARMEDVKAAIGKSLLPAWNAILGLLIEKVAPALDRVAGWLRVKIPQAIAVLTEALTAGQAWWVKNKDAVMGMANALAMFYTPAVGDATGKTKSMSSIAEQMLKVIKSLSIGVLQGVKIWLDFERTIEAVISGTASMITAAGHAINVMDRLSGGTGHAGDSMVRFGQDLKNQARRELKAVEAQSKATQRAIDKLHGKDVRVTAKGIWNPPKGFSAKTLIQMSTPGGRGGFAEGGRITQGTGPTADDVLIRASKGEAIVPARSAAKPAFKAWAAEEGIPGFATGGVIGRGVRQMNAITDRVAGGMGTVIARALKRALESGGGGSPAIKAFIRSVDPLPYVWGAAGPGAYDCSGLVSAVYGKHTGKGGGHGQRYFTTSSISASGGLKPGLGGTLQIGVTEGTGHMAGRYGGLGFEAEGSRTGIKIGAAASRPESFARHFYMARGGKIDPMLVALAARGGADVVGDPGNLRINGQSFDRGGTLAPGLNLVSNRTGRPEPLVPGGGIDYDRLAKAVARALRDAPPVVRVDDVHTGLLGKKRGKGGMRLGLD